MIPKNYNNYPTYQNYQLSPSNQIDQPFLNYQVAQPTNKIINYRELQTDEVSGPSFENPDPILLEVAKSVCKIRILTNKGTYISGTGFFLRFLINGKFDF